MALVFTCPYLSRPEANPRLRAALPVVREPWKPTTCQREEMLFVLGANKGIMLDDLAGPMLVFAPVFLDS